MDLKTAFVPASGAGKASTGKNQRRTNGAPSRAKRHTKAKRNAIRYLLRKCTSKSSIKF